MPLADKLMDRKRFPGREDVILATRGADLTDLVFSASLSELDRSIKRLRECVTLKDSRRSPKDPPIISVTANKARIEGELMKLRSYEDLQALIIQAESSGGIIRLGWKMHLMALPKAGIKVDSPSTGVEIAYILQRVSKKLMAKEVGSDVGDLFGDLDDEEEETVWTRIRRPGDSAALMLKLSYDAPPKSLTERVNTFFKRLPQMKDTEVVGPTSAFVSAAAPVLLLGQRYHCLVPVDGPTRERLKAALSSRGISSDAPWLLAPSASVVWEKAQDNPKVAKGLSPIELAYRLTRGLPLSPPPKLTLSSDEANVGKPLSGPVTVKGRPRRDTLPSPRRLAVDLGTVTKMEPRRAPPQGRTRKSHSTIQNPPPPKKGKGRERASTEPVIQDEVSAPPTKRGTTRRVRRRGAPLDLLSEPVVRILEDTLRKEAEMDREAQHDRVF